MKITIVLACPSPSRTCLERFFTSRDCAYYTWSYNIMRYWESHVDFQLKKQKKAEFGTFMCCTIIELHGMFLTPVWPNRVRNTLGRGEKALCSSGKSSREVHWCGWPSPVLITAHTHHKHQRAFFLSYSLSINGKLFLSKNMQNTLEGNCKTFRIRETYFDDF